MSKYILPIMIILCLIIAPIKKVNAYKSFVGGAKQSIPLVIDLFPYIAAIFIMVELINVSGLTKVISTLTSPIFRVFGIPEELSQLVILKPFTGSGSLALLSDIYTTYGVDSYVSRCASVIMGSSETVFYISTIYFSKTKVTKLLYAIPVSLIACLVGAIVSCALCKIM